MKTYLSTLTILTTECGVKSVLWMLVVQNCWAKTWRRFVTRWEGVRLVKALRNLPTLPRTSPEVPLSLPRNFSDYGLYEQPGGSPKNPPHFPRSSSNLPKNNQTYPEVNTWHWET